MQDSIKDKDFSSISLLYYREHIDIAPHTVPIANLNQTACLLR